MLSLSFSSVITGVSSSDCAPASAFALAFGLGCCDFALAFAVGGADDDAAADDDAFSSVFASA